MRKTTYTMPKDCPLPAVSQEIANIVRNAGSNLADYAVITRGWRGKINSLTIWMRTPGEEGYVEEVVGNGVIVSGNYFNPGQNFSWPEAISDLERGDKR